MALCVKSESELGCTHTVHSGVMQKPNADELSSELCWEIKGTNSRSADPHCVQEGRQGSYQFHNKDETTERKCESCTIQTDTDYLLCEAYEKDKTISEEPFPSSCLRGNNVHKGSDCSGSRQQCIDGEIKSELGLSNAAFSDFTANTDLKLSDGDAAEKSEEAPLPDASGQLFSTSCLREGKIHKERNSPEPLNVEHQQLDSRRLKNGCSECGKTFKNPYNLKRHKKIHLVLKSRSCDECGKSFANTAALTRHKKTHLNERKFICDQCGKAFSTLSCLKKHHRVHSGEKPYVCTECGQRFTASYSLKVHMRFHSGEKPYQCTECGMRFHTRATLKNHVLNHTGEKPNVCEKCGKRFKTAVSLRRHSHSEKPYKCAECGKGFTLLFRLTRHKRVHSSVKPYRCTECGKGFAREMNLKIHQRVHSGEKPYSCTLCGKSYAQQGGLTMHMKIHFDAKTKVCGHCGECFKNLSLLKRHLKIHSREKKQEGVALDVKNECDLSSVFTVDSAPAHSFTTAETEGLSRVTGVIKTEIIDPGYAEVEQHTNSPPDGPGIPVSPEDQESSGSTGVAAHKKGLAGSPNSESGLQMDCEEVKAEMTNLSTVILGGSDECQHTGDAETPVGQMKSKTVAPAELSAYNDSSVMQDLTADKSGMCVDLEQMKAEIIDADRVQVDRHLASPSASEDSTIEIRPKCSEANVVFSDVASNTETELSERLQKHTYENRVLSQEELSPLSCQTEKDIRGETEGASIQSEACSTKQPSDPDESKYVCSECGKCLKSPSALERHKRVHVSEKPHTCDECGKTFANGTYLTKHKYTHGTEKKHVCEQCGKGFISRSCLKKHLRVHSGEKPYVCTQCGQRFTASYSLKVHMRFHSGEKPYQCTECGMRFHTRATYKNHVLNHTGERPNVCEKCGKRFKNAAALRRHCHSERPYICTECGKSFTQLFRLKVHVRVHSGEKPYICNECGKSFSQLVNLKIHKRVHSGEKPYMCAVCGKGFSQLNGLTVHMKVHSREKQSVCDHCGKCFKHFADLNRHIKVHLDEIPLSCSDCGKWFADMNNLIHHKTSNLCEKGVILKIE